MRTDWMEVNAGLSVSLHGLVFVGFGLGLMVFGLGCATLGLVRKR